MHSREQRDGKTTEAGAFPLEVQFYLPERWTHDRSRCLFESPPRGASRDITGMRSCAWRAQGGTGVDHELTTVDPLAQAPISSPDYA
jgi:hypothetical protein